MSIDETELRDRLAAAAAKAGEPRFTSAIVAARVRRRRARLLAGIAGAVLAVAAVATAVPLTLAGSAPQRALSMPEALPPLPGFAVTVSGSGMSRSAASQPGSATTWASQPTFLVVPGERVTITVVITVPLRRTITEFWLGIVGDVIGGPGRLHPALVHVRTPLHSGRHRFTAAWTVPATLRPGTSRGLGVVVDESLGGVSAVIAQFAPAATTVRPTLGRPVPASIARRLRAMMLATARAKGDPRPRWILAVTATAAEAQRALDDPGGSQPTGNLVYLVYIKGRRFTLGGPPVLPGEPTGQYLIFAIDAATLQNLSVALATRAPDVPLASFGPVSVLYGAVS
jgi:hypothetical protein